MGHGRFLGGRGNLDRGTKIVEYSVTRLMYIVHGNIFVNVDNYLDKVFMRYIMETRTDIFIQPFAGSCVICLRSFYDTCAYKIIKGKEQRIRICENDIFYYYFRIRYEKRRYQCDDQKKKNYT